MAFTALKVARSVTPTFDTAVRTVKDKLLVFVSPTGTDKYGIKKGDKFAALFDADTNTLRLVRSETGWTFGGTKTTSTLTLTLPKPDGVDINDRKSVDPAAWEDGTERGFDFSLN